MLHAGVVSIPATGRKELRRAQRNGESCVTTERRVKLRGVLERTASSAEIKSDGGLTVELYDFSREAEEMFGNDVAFLLKISSDDKNKILLRLMAERSQMSDTPDRDGLLLRLLQERFADYYEVKRWLEENEIPFQKEFDSWA